MCALWGIKIARSGVSDRAGLIVLGDGHALVIFLVPVIIEDAHELLALGHVAGQLAQDGRLLQGLQVEFRQGIAAQLRS